MHWMREATFSGALVVAAIAAVAPAHAETLRAVGSFEGGHGSTQAMERLAAELAKTTFDRLDIEIEADPARTPAAVVQAVQDGEAAVGWTGLDALAPLVPAYGVVSLPFLFDDRDALFELLETDAGLGLLLDDELEKHGLGAIGFMDGGGRRIASTTGPIAGMDQLDSRPILVDGSEGQLAAMAATGMAPVAAGGGGSDEADYREVRLQDLIGGSSASGLTIADASHAADVIVVIANQARLDELALDLRELLVERMPTVAAWQRGAMAEAEADAIRDLEEQEGVTFAPLPDEVRAEAKARVRSMVEANAAPDDPLIEAVLANVE